MAFALAHRQATCLIEDVFASQPRQSPPIPGMMIVTRRLGALAEEPPQVNSLPMFMPLVATVRHHSRPCHHIHPREFILLRKFVTVAVIVSVFALNRRQEILRKHLPKHRQITHPLYQRPRQRRLEQLPLVPNLPNCRNRIQRIY
jgi:hypothetical protein